MNLHWLKLRVNNGTKGTEKYIEINKILASLGKGRDDAYDDFHVQYGKISIQAELFEKLYDSAMNHNRELKNVRDGS